MTLRTVGVVSESPEQQDPRRSRPPEAGLWAAFGGVAMFGFTVAVGIAILAAGLIDYSPNTDPRANAAAAEAQSTSELGETVFARSCASCHGATGDGGIGPQLSDGLVVAKYPEPADHRAIVVAGRGVMPAFAAVLTPEEIDAVVEYERSGL